MTIAELSTTSPSERSAYFRTAAADLQLQPTVIEKDFWVCWLLGVIFELSDATSFTFKGGTSLAKAFNAIDRFSEDIDISIARSLLGYPNNAYFLEGSGSERKRRVLELRNAVRTYVADTMLPNIVSHIRKSGIDSDATVKLDSEDTNRIVFTYPSSGIGGTTYINDRVLIDCGSGDTLPRHARAFSPYVAQVSRTSIVGRVEVPVLDPERSFWEKATILHDLAHRPGSDIPVRYSRHYYDVASMIKGVIGAAAESRPDILSDVVDFKNTFFARPSAQYDLARSGALRLRYDSLHAVALEVDYASMRTEMIFRDAPSLQEIRETLGEFEDRFNQGHTVGIAGPDGGGR